jgi:hypothetical protein
MRDIDNNDEFDLDETHDAFGNYDPFDEKTFHLELQVADPERRKLAQYIDGQLYQLAYMRAENENISLDDAFEHLFDPAYIRADIHGSDRARALLAEHISEALDELADLRCMRRYESPMATSFSSSAAANTNTHAKGVRRAV